MDAVQVTVKIAEKQYQIACPAEEEPMLNQAASVVGRQLSDVRKRSPNLNGERAAVLTALNMARELISLQQQQSSVEDTVARADSVLQRVDDAIGALQNASVTAVGDD